VLSFLQSDATALTIRNSNSVFDPHPYERAIPTLEVRKTVGPVRVSIADSSILLLEGGSENILRFMSWFDVPQDSRSGWHRHFDSLDGSPFVAKDCLDVVVGVI
jgi:hypothetical protein